MFKYFILNFFLFISIKIFPQPDLNFIRYTTQDGLAHNDVLCIYQDSLGFMWFGTKNGCSRFDGIDFINYQHIESDSNSIGPGWVNQIVSDSSGTLWFAIAGAGNTLMKYNYETDDFSDISSTIKEQLNLKNQVLNIWKIFPDNDGNIWTRISENEFVRYNQKNKDIKCFSFHSNKQKASPAEQGLLEKGVWFVSKSGVTVFNKEVDSLINFRHDPLDPLSLSSDKCNKLFRDTKGQIWVATYNGLNKLMGINKGNLSFRHFLHDPQNPSSISNNLIFDIAEDNNGNLFIATVNGLSLMDKKTNRIYRYFNSEIDNQSINSNLVRGTYKDIQGDIWIATNAGIGKLKEKNFKSYSQSYYTKSISHNKVQYLCEAPDSTIWIATPRGIDIFNRKKNSFGFLAGVTQNNKGLFGPPLSLCPDGDKGMWIGAWNGGISYYNHATKKFTNLRQHPSALQNESNILFMYIDNNKNLWASNSEKGVFVHNEQTGPKKIFTHDNSKPNTLSSDYAYSILEDSDSTIWIGTFNGLNMLTDFETGSFKTFLPGIEIKCITEGADKYLWLGTNEGLFRFDNKSYNYRNFTIKDGIPGKSIHGILEDSSNNFWISTNKGLVKLKLLNDSIANITAFHKEDGIEVGEFNERSCIKLSDGTMMFGGTEGFIVFHPSNIKTDTVVPKIVFTNLKVGNRSVDTGQKINGQVILEKSITLTSRLILNYENNSFSLHFAGLQYNMPKYNQYCYKLFGHEKSYPDWYYTDAKNRRAEFINLPSGNYTLNLMAANSYGKWNKEAAILKVTILPAWWKTAWFISLMLILLFLFIILTVRLRTYKLQKQKQKLEKIVEQRTAELKDMNLLLNERKVELETQAEELSAINNKLVKTNSELEEKTREVEAMAKKLHEADQLKLKFFANISHEFRTPLTLIIGPLERLLGVKQPAPKINTYHKLMLKNAKRLLRLINQVIDFRKIEHGEKKLNLSTNDIVKFTKGVIDAFSVQADQKNIQLHLKSQYPVLQFRFDADVMEKILYNLISNAIKYTPGGGEIFIEIGIVDVETRLIASLPNTQLTIKISDTGIGIKPENLDRIFDRFYRVKTRLIVSQPEGTGIGLAYAKELIELHNGTVSVESKSGEGTTFTLQFPINNELFKDEHAAHNNAVDWNHGYIRTMTELSGNISEKDKNSDAIKKIMENKFPEQKPKILIVEDNDDLRAFMRDELSSCFTMYDASNGSEGIEIAHNENIDLIISDVMMPVMNGIEFCKRIKTDKNTSHIPVILLTAKGSYEDKIEGLETGANDYIPKPFDIEILIIKINNLFQLRKRIQERFSKSVDASSSEITYSIVDQKFIQKAIDVVNDNLQNESFDNNTFIQLLNYGKTQAYKKIRFLTGQSVSEFIRSIRLKAAAQLFLEGHDNVTEVCYRTGFKHMSTFSQNFSDMFGKSPKEFIKDTLQK